MAVELLPHTGITFNWVSKQDNWGDAMNANLRIMDILVQAAVINRSTNTPPAGVLGATYIIGSAPTGAWAGHANKIAHYANGAWLIVTPVSGWEFYITDEGRWCQYNGTAWIPSRTSIVPFLNQAATSYTAVMADVGRKVRNTAATAVAHTIPPNSSVAFPVGGVLLVRQVGDGKVTLTPGAGVTFNTPTGYNPKTARKGSEVFAHKVATDEWDIGGDLEAV